MLKRSKNNTSDKLQVAAKRGAIVSVSPLSNPDSGDLRTIIRKHMSIEGSIRGEEAMEIEGLVKGTIELNNRNLTIGPKGRVTGEIHARNVSITGGLKGSVNALEKVEIKREADFHGEIKAKIISVEDGANFKGVIELESGPQRKSSDSAKRKESAAPRVNYEKGRPMSDVKKQR